jgi:hypothetical protein
MYEYIEFIICYGEGFTPDQVKEENRKQEVVFARQLIMYFCRMFNVGSLAAVGELMGNKDHATVGHAVKTIKTYLEVSKAKKAKIEYYEMLIRKVIHLKSKTDGFKDLLNPLEKEISELEQRCINLQLQIAFLKNKTAMEELNG